jgi:hypothetical protein
LWVSDHHRVPHLMIVRDHLRDFRHLSGVLLHYESDRHLDYYFS